MELNKADVAWGTLFVGVAGYDLAVSKDWIDGVTMSERFGDYLEHPLTKYLAIGATVMTGYHLLKLAEHFGTPDPMTETARFVTKTVEGMIHGGNQ